MPNIARYLVRLAAGQVKVFRSDGEDMTVGEVAWFKKVVSDRLRTEALAAGAGTNLDRIMDEDAVEGVRPSTGAAIRIHPLVKRMRSIIQERGWKYSDIAGLLGKSSTAVGSWFRGQAVPTMSDVYSMYGMAGLKLTPVPLDIADQVEALVDAWVRESARQEEDAYIADAEPEPADVANL
jgi:transcriptional regulator with XRE-family HTH domain